MTDKLTDAEIEEGLKLAEKATEGPWEYFIESPGESDTDTYVIKWDSKNERITAYICEGILDCDGHHDGPFIAASRTLLPRALKELQELREICSNQTGEILNLQNELKDIKSEIWVGNVMHWKSRAEKAEEELQELREELNISLAEVTCNIGDALEWKSRAEKAEARLEKAVKALEEIANHSVVQPERLAFQDSKGQFLGFRQHAREALKEIRGEK